MNTVESIEAAVSQLPEKQLAEFRHWFLHFDAAAWDQKLESDASSGRLDHLASEALVDYNTGKAREI